MLRKILIVVAILLIVLFITNPSQTSFTNFLNAKGIGTKYTTLNDTWHTQLRVSYGRSAYFGIFSIYEYRAYSQYTSHNTTYLGIFGNFFKLKYQNENLATVSIPPP